MALPSGHDCKIAVPEFLPLPFSKKSKMVTGSSVTGQHFSVLLARPKSRSRIRRSVQSARLKKLQAPPRHPGEPEPAVVTESASEAKKPKGGRPKSNSAAADQAKEELLKKLAG